MARLIQKLKVIHPPLTAREAQVCAGILQGLTIDGIACALDVSACTVKTYRNRAFDRLGIHFRNELFALVLAGLALDLKVDALSGITNKIISYAKVRLHLVPVNRVQNVHAAVRIKGVVILIDQKNLEAALVRRNRHLESVNGETRTLVINLVVEHCIRSTETEAAR